MSEFHIGDKVRVVANSTEGHNPGTIGEIIAFHSGSKDGYPQVLANNVKMWHPVEDLELLTKGEKVEYEVDDEIRTWMKVIYVDSSSALPYQVALGGDMMRTMWLTDAAIEEIKRGDMTMEEAMEKWDLVRECDVACNEEEAHEMWDMARNPEEAAEMWEMAENSEQACEMWDLYDPGGESFATDASEACDLWGLIDPDDGDYVAREDVAEDADEACSMWELHTDEEMGEKNDRIEELEAEIEELKRRIAELEETEETEESPF